jgi:hypothetical protein
MVIHLITLHVRASASSCASSTARRAHRARCRGRAGHSQRGAPQVIGGAGAVAVLSAQQHARTRVVFMSACDLGKASGDGGCRS